jgi:hypothetical protein
MLLVGLAVALLVLATAEAGGDKGGKEKTIKGLVCCAKCNFKAVKKANPDAEKPDVCQTIIIAKGKKGAVIYFFDAEGHKKHHGKICTTPTLGEVTGTISKEGDKRIITVTDVKLKKKKTED